MKTKNIIISLICALIFPLGVFALSAPTVDSVPSQMDANSYTFTINAPVGSTVSVLGGPSHIAPVTDGAGSDELDGVVEVIVGLAQEQDNVFSITAEKDGESSDAIMVTIHETSAGGSVLQGDHTPPDAPVLDPIENPVKAYEYTITGSVEADANIYVRKGEDVVGSTRANSNGIFFVTVNLEMGKTNRFNVSAEDGAGNEGFATQTVIQAVQPDYPEPEPEEEGAVEDPQTSTCIFTDISGHWAEGFICKLYDKGVVSGKSATSFAPDEYISRAALAKIVVNIFNHAVPDDVTENPFPDVPKDAWYAPYVTKAKEEAIVGGFPDGTFKPGDLITRAAALKMLVVASGLDYFMSQSDFPDVRSSDWFANYVGFAQENNVVGGYGDGTFRPGNSITRAEAVKMSLKLLELK